MLVTILKKLFHKPHTRPIPGDQSIAEPVYQEINEVDQWLLIRGVNRENPVLLILQGGPGLVFTGMTSGYQSILEEHFVVVHWHYRGTGKSFRKNIPPSSLNFQQIVDDAVLVVDYLKTKLGKQRVHLLGFSWGTIIGCKLAQYRPDLFHSLIVVGQLTHVLEMEKKSFEFARTEAHRRKDQAGIKQINQIRPIDEDSTNKDLMAKQGLVHKYGGNYAHGGPISKLVSRLMFNADEHGFGDILNIFRGLSFSGKHLFEPSIRTNLFEEVPSLEIPYVLIYGSNDQVCVPALMDQYYDQLRAPQKKKVVINGTAHFPQFSKPELFQQEVVGAIQAL